MLLDAAPTEGATTTARPPLMLRSDREPAVVDLLIKAGATVNIIERRVHSKSLDEWAVTAPPKRPGA